MAKPRINPFSDAAYRHYDPLTETPGSPDEWSRLADQLASGNGVYIRTISMVNRKIHPDLAKINLDSLPETLVELKRAFRNTLFLVHPDYGGTNEQCREALAAFERLAKHYVLSNREGKRQ